MELVMREWLLRRLYPDRRHKSEALVEGKPAPPFSRNTSSPKMTGKKNIPPPPVVVVLADRKSSLYMVDSFFTKMTLFQFLTWIEAIYL